MSNSHPGSGSRGRRTGWTALRVERVVSVESETEPAFAGLHQPCAPVLGNLVCLPGPQRDALGVVFISQSRNRHGRIAAQEDPRLITGHLSEQAISAGKG